jgi:ATP phosphoribosyltransferase
VADYALVDSQGATEGTVKNGTAEAIADITSTGETLRANHLKVLADGLIHPSQATLYAARAADWSPANLAALTALAARLGLPVPVVSG